MQKKMALFLNLFVVSLSLGEFSIFGVKSSIIGLLLFLVTLFIHLFTRKQSIIVSKSNFYVILFLLFFIVYSSVINILNKIDLVNSGLYISLLSNIFISIIILFILKNQKDILTLTKAIKVALVINIILGLYNVITGNHFTEIEYGHIRYSSNIPIGYYGNPNDYASFMFFGLVALVTTIMINKKNVLLNFLLLFVTVYLIYMTGSRSAILSTLIFIVLLLTTSFFRSQISKHHKIILTFSFIVVTVISFLIIANYNDIISIIENDRGNPNYSSNIMRLYLIKDGLHHILNNLGLGTGTGSSILIRNINVHNLFLEICIEYGVLIALGFIFILLRPTLSKRIADNRYYSLFISFVPSFILITIASSSILKDDFMWLTLIYIYVFSHCQLERGAESHVKDYNKLIY